MFYGGAIYAASTRLWGYFGGLLVGRRVKTFQENEGPPQQVMVWKC